VVSVEVEDPDAFTGFGEGGGDDGDVGHEAEAHRLRRRGVVPRRAHGAERRRALAALQRCDRREAGPCGQRGGGRGLRAGRRVGVDPAASGRGEMVETIEVPRRVDTFEIAAGGRTRLEWGDGSGQIRVAHGGGDGGEPRRSFRMMRPGDVLEEERVGREQDRHTDNARARSARDGTLTMRGR